MGASNQAISDVLRHLDLADLIEEDYYDVIDHGELVGMLVGLLCRQMGLSKEFREKAVWAAYVHDIGKLRLGRNLYGRNKQALEIESLKYMRLHTQLGMEMLQAGGYPEEVLRAVYHHHENYDGSGYPDNLSGVQIPLAARILRVCDAFSALISDRPYRRAFEMGTALEMMIEDNKAFDIGIFLEFFKLYHSAQFAAAAELSQQINAKRRYDRNIPLG